MVITCDVAVVGAGYIGCSIAHSLCRAGLRTALIDQGDVAAGASRANYGNVQVQDAELDHSLPLVTRGYARFATLEAELGCSVGYRRLGSLLVIETESQWHTLAERLPRLHAVGIRAEMVQAQQLRELEPMLDSSSVLGACYHESEGQVYPFALMWGYVRRALQMGLTLHTHTSATALDVQGGRVAGLQTSRGAISCPRVILATGAWTPSLARALGRNWSIQHVRGQALVTERVNVALRNHIASAAFFEATQVTQNEDGGHNAQAVLALSQSAHGNFLLGEVAAVTTELDSHAIPSGISAIAAMTSRYFPMLKNARGLRTWVAPVAFTSDGMPYLGPVAGLPGLIVATAFKSTVIVTPLVGELVTQVVLGQPTEIDLTPFSPDREIARTSTG